MDDDIELLLSGPQKILINESSTASPTWEEPCKAVGTPTQQRPRDVRAFGTWTAVKQTECPSILKKSFVCTSRYQQEQCVYSPFGISEEIVFDKWRKMAMAASFTRGKQHNWGR